MLHGKLLSWALVGAIGVGAAGGTAVSAAKRGPLDSPVAKLIAGTVGRWLVLRSEMDLTGEQQQKIHRIVAAHKAELGRAAVEVYQKRKSLRDAVLAEKSDEQAIRKAAEELGQSIGNAAVLAAEVKQEVAPVLTEEQRSLIGRFIRDNDAAAVKFFREVGGRWAAGGERSAARQPEKRHQRALSREEESSRKEHSRHAEEPARSSAPTESKPADGAKPSSGTK